jgi:hypothetical protein
VRNRLGRSNYCDWCFSLDSDLRILRIGFRDFGQEIEKLAFDVTIES